ncbi:MAG: hypothetical protein JSU95_10830 [Betaproteobacteria bacterium]|nr:MAG: hypothetical protein JSU95_10830 [Betaproteobacteria bacterium]
MRNTLFVTSLITGLIVLSSGCTSWQTDKGVEAIWRQPDHGQWSVGSTTDEDVISALGPPSQMIALDDETVFYYMREKSKGQAYIFILWNTSQQTVEYDRAVFFFDKQGVLLKYAYSKENEVDHGEN